METKQKLILGAVGVLSAVGLGWMVTRIVKPGEGEPEATPDVEANISWD